MSEGRKRYGALLYGSLAVEGRLKRPENRSAEKRLERLRWHVQIGLKDKKIGRRTNVQVRRQNTPKKIGEILQGVCTTVAQSVPIGQGHRAQGEE